MLNILCIGDVVGKCSCEHLIDTLPTLKKQHNINMTIVNGENSADGNGITPFSANLLFCAGVDIITGGNHTLKRKEIYEMLESNPSMTCPQNIESADIGRSVAFCDLGRCKVAVINLAGTVYMEAAKNPFHVIDDLIAYSKSEGALVIIVDFHAEATSEKRAMGLYLDGKVSAIFGTHTHIATADLSILKNGTGYITDIGMCGPDDSVLGVQSEIIIDRFVNSSQNKFIYSQNKTVINGCVFRIDEKSGKTVSCEQIIL